MVRDLERAGHLTGPSSTLTRMHYYRQIFSIALGLVALASTVCAADIAAGPDPKEIPLPPIETAMGKMPGATELPTREAMPEVLTTNDGSRVSTVAEWQKRREEMKRILEYYAVGQSPP